MKLLLFALLFTRLFDYGITRQLWFDTPTNIFCLAQTDKISPYVDIKIQVARERIIGPVFIETNNGDFSIQPESKLNKNGYSIIRLFFRSKEQWTSIDSGITFLIVYTEQNTYRIKLNSNLKQLKDYANEK